jgi:predicted transcriptional regulator
MKILLSIKPEYTKRIFSGEKKYEFRKQKPKLVIERAYVYESYPSRNIVGWFSVKRILSGSPKKIWSKCKNLGGIERKEYFDYCNGKKVIYAFEIDDIFQFDNPIDPFTTISNFNPPQNFAYLNEPIIFEKLENIGGFGRIWDRIRIKFRW